MIGNLQVMAVIGALVVLPGCVTTSPTPIDVEIGLATPASIELTQWCPAGGTACDQAAADRAQSHCRASGRNAQLAGMMLVERSFTQGEKTAFRFNCVN